MTLGTISEKAREAWVAARKAWHSKPYTVHRSGSFRLGNNIAAIDAIQTALDEARADAERQIVEWLRAEGAARPGDNWLGWIAGRIEKGEHRG